MQSVSYNPANNANIQMKGNEQKKKRGFFGAFLNTAKDVGLTAAAGVGSGVAAGSLISLIPVKNVKGTAEVLTDTFINAAKETTPRPYINPAKTGDQFKKAQKVLDVIDLSDAIQKKQALEETKKLINDAKNDKELGAVIKGLFVEGADIQSLGLKAPKGDYTKNSKTIKAAKDNILKQLDKLIDPKVKTDEKAIKSLADKYTKAIKALNESAVKYIESAAKDDELLKLAKKEAKRVRRGNIIGNAVYIGILTMFAMNLINLFVPKKGNAEQGAPNNQGGVQQPGASVPPGMVGTTQG